MPHIRFFNYLFVCIQSNSSIGRGETSRRRVWESKWWRSELAPLERLTCKQPRHISRAPTRDTVGKKISGEDTRGLRRSLYLYVYTIACTCTYVKEPTHESGETQVWGRTPFEVNTNYFFSFSIAVSVLSYPLFQWSLRPSFLLLFVLFAWIGWGWCGWGDYSSDQYCRAVGSSVNKMASVQGPSTLAILFTEDSTALQYWSEL